MSPRAGLSKALLIDQATELVDREGPQNLSLAALAKHFGVKPPSLYNHVGSLEDLRRELRLRGLEGLAGSLRHAVMGRAGYEALVAIAHAYRNFAKQHPGLYALTLQSTEGDDDAVREAGWAVVEVVLAVLRAYDLAEDEALHATRCLRSALHGFVALETGGGFGLSLNLDESFERLVALLDCGLKVTFNG